MNGGLLHSAAGMNLATQIQDLRAQNIANANTIGYRRKLASAEAFSASLRAAAGLTLPDYREEVDLTAGRIIQTGEPLDIAIDGKAYLAVETDRGVRYTKNGSMQLDADSTLVAFDGTPILGEAGPIQIDPARGPIAISKEGDVTQDGETLGRLRVAEFENERQLISEGEGRYRARPGQEPLEPTESRVLQGHIEQSNVNVIDELVQMIAGFRAFEAAQKALVSVDRIRQQSVTNSRQ